MNAFYAQSGGVTAVINATACGVIETARKHPNKIANVYAGRNGIIGALTENMVDTSKESAAAIAALMHTPGGAFGSARYKLKGIEENRAEYERLIEVFKAHDIGYFFYNGGNDSMDTAHKVSQISRKMGFPVTCLGVPKTVDNDLPVTDNCPGFGSVAKYVAVSTQEAAMDVASMAETSTKVFILEVMGRHAGWIAAAGGLAGKTPADAPHIILFPEIPFRKREFLKKVRQCVNDYGYCVIVVSEGARFANGKFLAEAGTRDAFGHAQLGGVAPVVATMVRDSLGYKSLQTQMLSRLMPWARPPYSTRCRASLRSCPSSSGSPTSRIAGQLSRRRSAGSPTRKRCSHAATSAVTASGSPRQPAATLSH
jgi:6-phosphofructokinase 1